MKSHKLTIIIPHYNSSDLLEKLLSTIPKDKNIEVIIVDDKSEDKHINYIQDMQSSGRYTKFILLKNETSKKGAGVARNIGLEKANGKWILFADSDDYFSENFYESISEYFGSDNEVVFFKPASIYLDTSEIADRHIGVVAILDNYINCATMKNELDIRYRWPMPWSKLIKKHFIEKNKIVFDEVIASNDVMFSTRVGCFMKKFEISNKIIYIATKNKGSLTTNISENIFDIRLKTTINQYDFIKLKLSEENFKLLDLSTSTRIQLVNSLRYGIFKFFKVIMIFVKNDIRFFSYKLLNPIHLYVRIREQINRNKIETKYHINK